MRKLSLCVLFLFVFGAACQAPTQQATQLQPPQPEASPEPAPTQTEPELVLLYSADGVTHDLWYKDLHKGEGERALPLRGYDLVSWDSPEKILVSEYDTAYEESSTEYYVFDTKANSLECITCDLDIIGRKELSPSRQKIAIYHYDRIEIMTFGDPAETVAEVSGFEFVSTLSWSPDESFIIFMDGGTHLYRFNLKDQSLVELVKEPSAIQIFYPGLSPAGDKLAFYLLDENYNLYLAGMSPDGTGFKVLADLTLKDRSVQSSENTSTSFSWSPEGERLVFTNELEQEAGAESPLQWDGIYIVSFEGGQPVLIDDTPESKWSVSWSPDGSLIAFVANQYGTQPDIWTITPEGKNRVNRTVTPERPEFGPSWK